MAYTFGAGWGAVETALYTWLQTATGLPVRYEFPKAGAQPVPQVHGDRGELSIQSWVPRGNSPMTTLVHHPANPPAQELERVTRRAGTLVVRAQLYTAATKGPTAAFPRMLGAAAVLDTLGGQQPFQDAGLALQERGDVRNLTGVVGMGAQGRAALELRFDVREVVTDFVGAVSEVTFTTVVT